MKVALLQFNPTVGDLAGNANKILKFAKMAKSKGAELCVTSELALLGYPPRDLLLSADFIKKSWNVMQKLAKDSKSLPPILVGTATANKNKQGRPLYNCAAFLEDGIVKKIFLKSLLPTYDVFDEDRYFEPGEGVQTLSFRNQKIGVSICEDLWNDRDFWKRPRYKYDPVEMLAQDKVDLIINLSSSPFSAGKQKLRELMIKSASRKHKVAIIYVNQVGSNDDLIFDGASLIFDKKGKLRARARAFEEDVLVLDIEKLSGSQISKYPSDIESIYKALSLGLSDYMGKCGFKSALIGLSGGIDSSVVACIAQNALGKKGVTGVLMPSPYTASESISDALKLAKNLGIRTVTIPITPLMESYGKSLEKAFAPFKRDITEENIQARIRGNILMALSNKYGSLVLSTGNKSELTVGYTTLYGDLAGGQAVIGDLFKTQVYNLAKWINRKNEVIPKNVIRKPPSAELRPNQKDQDILPPYDVLDKILYLYVEKQKGPNEIVKEGFEKKLVRKVFSMIANAEFKRRQAPPTLKVTGRAFGPGWRMPVAAKHLFIK